MCVRYRTKELEASGKQVGLKKTIFLFRTRRTHFRRGKKKKKKQIEFKTLVEYAT